MKKIHYHDLKVKKKQKIKIIFMIVLLLTGLFLLTYGGIYVYTFFYPCWNLELHYELKRKLIPNVEFIDVSCPPKSVKLLVPTYTYELKLNSSHQ